MLGDGADRQLAQVSALDQVERGVKDESAGEFVAPVGEGSWRLRHTC